MTKWIRFLKTRNACKGAIKWAARYRTPGIAWRYCKRGDWMRWFIKHFADDKTILDRLFRFEGSFSSKTWDAIERLVSTDTYTRSGAPKQADLNIVALHADRIRKNFKCPKIKWSKNFVSSHAKS